MKVDLELADKPQAKNAMGGPQRINRKQLAQEE